VASRGVPAVAATYRATDAGVRLPRSIADIRCAAAAAAEVTSTDASGPRPVVLLGHSAGAHLAAVTVLTPGAPRPPCRYAAARFVGLVGLAGPYDLADVADAAEPLVGAPPAAEPEAWRAADPLLLAEHPPPGLAVLLMHGSADPLVPARHTVELARVLRGSGTGVTVHMLAGADHDTVYGPRIAGPPLLRWLSHEWWR
jgi:acetyl esterase/lipase